jgi:hypothetical protein
MSRARTFCVVCLAAVLTALCAAGPLRAESMPTELAQMLEAVEREEAAAHYAAAYVRLREVERRAKDGNHAAVLERVDELGPFLESSTQRQVYGELDRYVRTQLAARPEQLRKLGPPSEPSYQSECGYDEEARNYACAATIEDSGRFRCVAGEGATRCSRGD